MIPLELAVGTATIPVCAITLAAFERLAQMPPELSATVLVAPHMNVDGLVG